MKHLSLRCGVSLSLCLLAAACGSVAPPAAPAPVAAVAPPVRDRAIWDGLPATVPAGVVAAPRRAARPAPAVRTTSGVPTVRGLSFDDEPLFDALKHVQLATGAPIVVTPKARQVIDENDVRITLELTAPLRLDRLLDLLAGRDPGLGWKVDDGVIWFTTKADARGPLTLRMADVRELVMETQDFPGPKLRLPGEHDESFVEEPEPRPRTDPDQLVDLIRNATGPAYWEETEGASIELTADGILLVRADAAMHRRIGRAL